MSEKATKIPQIRFDGYTDAWEQRKLGDEAEILAGGDIDKVKLRETGKYPVFANALTNDGIVGYYDDEFRVEAPAVTVTGRGDVGHAQARKINFTPVVRLLSVKSKHDVDFLENAINNHKVLVESTGVPQLTSPQLGNYKIWFTTLEEESKIGNFFSQLDHLITLHQRECDLLAKMKKSYLQKMFPKNGEDKPEIRFDGYTDAWEERKLLDNVDKVLDYRGKSPTKFGMEWGTEGYLVLSALNVKNGYIDKSVEAKYGDQELFERWMGSNRLEKGDVLFTTEAPLGNVAQVPDDKGYILNQRAVAFKSSKDTDNNFFAQLLRSPIVQNTLNANSSGGTAKGIGMKEFAKLNAHVPKTFEEQQKIGSFFKQLDNTIALHQRELDSLKKMKKSLLQMMFV